MRLAGVLGVLLFVAAPVMAGEIDYTFDVISGTLTVDTTPNDIAVPDPAIVNLGGTFMATFVTQSDGHIGESDTILLGNAMLSNTDQITLVLASLATANILPGSAKFTGFEQPVAAHIGGGGVGALETDAEFQATMFVTGLMTTTFATTAPAGTLLPFTFEISTSVPGSQTIQLALAGVFRYEIPVSDIGATLTLDLIIDIVGTTHAVPDPAFGGLTAMGLAGAGAWIRRRRS